jgi:Putative MetA-pathway of phenol degradation
MHPVSILITNMKPTSTTIPGLLLALAVTAQAGTPAPAPAPVPTGDWLSETISPVTNPIYFEDPAIRSEVRPIFMHHRIDSGFPTGADNVNVYAVQFRWAITDRLAFIATKDGYVDTDIEAFGNPSGWADLAAGLKYAIIDDRANEFILTGGFTVDLPTGSSDVFQGNGDGELNLFVSTAKGFGKLHLTGHAGIRIPFDNDEESTIFHFNAMADYKLHQYFHPYVAVHGLHVVDSGDGTSFGGVGGVVNSEGYDLINFGAPRADGETFLTVAAGFRSHLTPSIDVGFGYEWAVTSPEGLFDDRITVDAIWRF